MNFEQALGLRLRKEVALWEGFGNRCWIELIAVLDLIGPSPSEHFSETNDDSVAILLTHRTARLLYRIKDGLVTRACLTREIWWKRSYAT